MEVTPSLVALQLVTGIALGAVYALLALGLSLIFGMLAVVNFAHGAFFMVGAFVGLYFLGLPWLHTWGSGRFSGVARDALFLAEQIEALRASQPRGLPLLSRAA